MARLVLTLCSAAIDEPAASARNYQCSCLYVVPDNVNCDVILYESIKDGLTNYCYFICCGCLTGYNRIAWGTIHPYMDSIYAI